MREVLFGLGVMLAAAALGLLSALGLLVWWGGGEKWGLVVPRFRRLSPAEETTDSGTTKLAGKK